MAKLKLITGVPRPPSNLDGIPDDCAEHSVLGAEERKFVNAYLQEPNLYRVAHVMGISHGRAVAIRRRPKVLKAIRKGRRKLENRCLTQPYHLLKELQRIATSDITEFEFDPATGKIVVAGNEPGATRAISSIKRKVTRRLAAPNADGAVAETVVHSETEIKLWSKIEATALMAKLLGWMDRKQGESEPTKVYVNLDMRGILSPQPSQGQVIFQPLPLPSAENSSSTQESMSTPSDACETAAPTSQSENT